MGYLIQQSFSRVTWINRGDHGVLDWESLKSLVVLNFELEFRSEGMCGLDLKDGAVPARETYIDNAELVVDVVACFNCFCKKKESRCCHSSLTQLMLHSN